MRGNRFSGYGGAYLAPGLIMPLGRSFYDLASLGNLADTDPVATWPDSYHGLFDLVPGTEVAPVYTADAGTGLPAVLFDGATMRLGSPGGAPRYDLQPPLSFFFVFSVPSLPASSAVLFDLTDSATAISLDTSGILSAGAASVLSTVAPIVAGEWYAVSIIMNGASSRLRLYSGGAVIEDITGDMGTAGASGVLYVGANSSAAAWFAGYLAQIVFSATIVSDLDIAGYETDTAGYTA